MKIEAIPFEELAVGKQADGLIPAIVQDDRTLQVLMLGYMNREAYEKSLAEGRVTFYSRTRRAASARPCPKPRGSSAACKPSSANATPRCPKAPTRRGSSRAA